ncbi:UV excision repair protein RAD23 homolog B-like, partial [Condylostylus longicornis]|uniref:UV excision repair protein RAD23 homolog B-like n=1 Tax=Condylostylus longicornis TaxID=2530218 RepID=UPI00244E216C
MKITIKTLRQQVYHIESNESETVRNLKEKLEILSNYILPANRMKLIYSGLILEDDKLLSEYNIDEKKFMVVMIRPENSNFNNNISTSTSQHNNEGNLTEVITISSQQSINSIQSNNEQQIQPILEESSQPSNILEYTQSLTDPIEIENAISNVMNALRFSRNEVEQAFNISFNNPYRAVDYLLHGNSCIEVQNQIETNLSHIENINEQVQQSAISGNTNSQYQESNQQNATEQIHRSSPLDFLRNNPQFQQIRVLLQQNPSMIDFVIQRIGETNVGLLELISQNQDDFIDMINEPIQFHNNSTVVNENDTVNENGVVTISGNDWNAITGLMELGFSESECVEAYLACERNEEIAANYLLSKDDNL